MSDSVTYEYDEAGRLKKLVFADSTEVEYELDDAGNREQVTVTQPS
ncbi:MAG: RHS repeat domain-containing protein [Candidatus Melainabacteria bacterium]|nr:RHS repeat domain-containing protein [Candidatus Melainabacteria bacterium]